MIISLFTFALSFTVSASASPNFCLKEVEAQVSSAGKTYDKFDLDYYSQADLTQKVTGPLRRNRLSQAEASEIREMSEDKGSGFYQLTTWQNGKIGSELLVVDRKECKIKKQYVLLTP